MQLDLERIGYAKEKTGRDGVGRRMHRQDLSSRVR